MSEDKKPSENNVTYWSPPLPWFAPRCISREKDDKEVIIEVPKEEKVEAKD